MDTFMAYILEKNQVYLQWKKNSKIQTNELNIRKYIKTVNENINRMKGTA
jgi:hypothetical protein